MSKTKIFVTYKNRHQLFKSDIITPIQTGRAIADEIFDEMLGDDTGENISSLNNNFCELSAIYWVWKNQDKIDNPERIGFMHYRRHFLFHDGDFATNGYYTVLNRIKYDYEILENNIEKFCSQYEIITAKKMHLSQTVYEQYANYHDVEDYDKAIEFVKLRYPEFTKSIDEYNQLTYGYYFNMFVFPQKIFNEYCTWLFDILFEVFDNIGKLKENAYQQRAIGFIAERLTGVYIYNLIKNGYNVKELPVCFIENVSPIYKEIIPVVVSSSNEYVPILSTCIESIKDNSSKEYLYEINILEHNITEDNKRILNTQFKNSNIKLNFINIKGKVSKFKKYIQNSRFTIDTFSRFLISELLHYDKCVYLDLDTIVLDDIKVLYDTNLEDNYLGACIDSSFIGMSKNDKKYVEYAQEVLKLDKIEDYFQAGVLVFNLHKMRENNIEKQCLDVLNNFKLYFADQCVFNYLFKNNVKFVDLSWNYQFNDKSRRKINLKKHLPIDILKQYNEAYKKPRIVHYSTERKPWFYPSEEYAQIWWQYARKTPFYEQLLEGLTLRLIEQQKAVDDFWKNCFLYWFVKVLKCFSFGKVNKNLNKKQFELKEKIRLAKEIIKTKQ